MPEQEKSGVDTLVRLLGGGVIAIIAMALLYTSVIGLLNLSRIGV